MGVSNMLEYLSVRTGKKIQFVDISREIKSIVEKHGIKSGLCTIYVPHTTAGVTINENSDPDVVTDMIMEINKLVPFKDGYLHMEGNSAAHIQASLIGASQSVIIDNGRLLLGTWQGIYFCEFDGPRERKVIVKLMEG